MAYFVDAKILCFFVFVDTINRMSAALVWDEEKRRINLRKHGLDFVDAREVLESRFRLDVAVERHGEQRIQSFSYVLDRLRVLTVVHTDRDGAIRVISYRPADETETEAYREWLENEWDDA